MNKQQIIAPLVAMAIAFLIGFAIHSRNQRSEYLQMRAMGIGRDFALETNSPGVVHLGNSLSNVLVNIHSAPVSIHRVRLGDFGPGDGKAMVCVYLTNETGTCIGIRMRPDTKSDRFHILGYWTESSPRVP